jgi:hypothetical protein
MGNSIEAFFAELSVNRQTLFDRQLPGFELPAAKPYCQSTHFESSLKGVPMYLLDSACASSLRTLTLRYS